MSASERWLQEQVRQLCKDLDLAVQHIERSDLARAWLPGWPDLEIIGAVINSSQTCVTCGQSCGHFQQATLYRELKQAGEHPTTAQRRTGYLIQAAGGNWDVWRPQDLLSGRITRELTAISRIGART